VSAERAILLVNLGSPDSPAPRDVKRYLAEFLSDERVIDIPAWQRSLLLNCIILPLRAPRSARAYQKIWLSEGSPLVVSSQRLRALVEAELDVPVELAMRYGAPSIESAIDRLAARGIRELFVVPLYPHYAMSSYETVVVRVREVVKQRASAMSLRVLQPFYADSDYVEALYESARPALDAGYDHVLFSYHGLPMRHLTRADSSRGHCLKVQDCCEAESPAHATCYRFQTLSTTRAFVRRAGISGQNWSISYQSRLGREAWMEPYTDRELARLGALGVKRLLVLTPAFVADCLETLEEIAMAGRATFQRAGGGEFQHVACLNEHPAWVSFLVQRGRAWLNAGSQPLQGVDAGAHLLRLR
jgi:ferrochelatase